MTDKFDPTTTCQDCGEPHTEGFDAVDFDFLPPDPEPAWSAGLNHVMDDAFDAVSEHVETTDAEPLGACVFVLHSDGKVTIVAGGRGLVSDHTLALAVACDAVRTKLLDDASASKVEEVVSFLDALAQMKR